MTSQIVTSRIVRHPAAEPAVRGEELGQDPLQFPPRSPLEYLVPVTLDFERDHLRFADSLAVAPCCGFEPDWDGRPDGKPEKCVRPQGEQIRRLANSRKISLPEQFHRYVAFQRGQVQLDVLSEAG